MHYEEYVKAQGELLTRPIAGHDFYEELRRVAKSRFGVLGEIEQVRFKQPTLLNTRLSRTLDIVFSILGILACFVPMSLIGVAIVIDSPGSIFYRQRRVGKGGKIFWMLKFRTMRAGAEERTGPVWASEKDPRVTRVGRFLRDLRLDEVPQLFNILKGDMTFVGPRPERPEFVYWFTRYMPAFDRRHVVKPGIAGLAQLMNGYDSCAKSIYRKLRWDVYYIKRKCVQTDLHILWWTVIAVLQRKI